MNKYLKVWWWLTHISLATNLATIFSSFLFLTGKIIRFVFFFIFLFGLSRASGGIAGYSSQQVIVFYLVFNLVDTTTQLFFRGVYFFRRLVVNGSFDYLLIRPMSPLFRALIGYTDMLDLITLIPLVGYTIWFLIKMNVNITNLLWFGVMFLSGCILALTFHILILALGVVTTEVDNSIMLYRDLTAMGRMPIDIYTAPVREILTFIIPIAVMITFPAKALLGLLSWEWILFSLLLTCCFLLISLRFWKYALSQYSSASS